MFVQHSLNKSDTAHAMKFTIKHELHKVLFMLEIFLNIINLQLNHDVKIIFGTKKTYFTPTELHVRLCGRGAFSLKPIICNFSQVMVIQTFFYVVTSFIAFILPQSD